MGDRATEPAGRSERGETARIRRVEDAPRLVVREVVVGEAAALDHRDPARPVEFMQPAEARISRGLDRTGHDSGKTRVHAERCPRIRIVPGETSHGERQQRMCTVGQEPDPAASGNPSLLVVAAQGARAVGDRGDRVEPVVAAVENDRDQVTVAACGERLPDQSVRKESGPECHPGGEKPGAPEESASIHVAFSVSATGDVATGGPVQRGREVSCPP